jgi:hypothetical protein
MIGRIVGRPRRDLIAELHLNADDLAVPRDHLVEMTRLHGDVVKLWFDHLIPRAAGSFIAKRAFSQIR